MKFTYYCIFVLVLPPSQPVMTPKLAQLQKEMSTDLIVALSNETQDYKPKDVADIMNRTRREYVPYRYYYRHYGYYIDNEKTSTCFITMITYKAAIVDLRRYFELRFLYVNNVEFEVGYLTHEILHRYQTLLELYQLAERRFLKHEHKNHASASFMLHMYTNVLEQSKALIHLCNMFHEIERKYFEDRQRVNPKYSVFDDYRDGDSRPRQNDSNSAQLAPDNENAYQLWLKKKQQQDRKKLKSQKKSLEKFKKFGTTTPRKKTTPKKSNWPLHYGWSIEEW